MKNQSFQAPDVRTYSVAHMTAQIRAKQLATKTSQDNLLSKLREILEDKADVSGENLVKKIGENILSYLKIVESTNRLIAPKETLKSVGYPIKFNKTEIQLKMALGWVQKKGEQLLSDIAKKKLYNDLYNEASQLPVLQSPEKSIFWGNENPSVSTVLLYSAAWSIGGKIEPYDMVGAGTFYPFFDCNYTLSIPANPFIFEEGMMLFGDYQFGGHRYFSNDHPGIRNRLFSPEDCSSAVGKAIGLTEKQILEINTTALISSYTAKTNSFDFQPVTSSLDNGGIKFGLIQAGDIYVHSGHTAIISEMDNFGNASTLQFNRDIDRDKNKLLGGGAYQYDLSSSIKPVYILRKDSSPLKESCPLSQLITKIDSNYTKFYGDSLLDGVGECGAFLTGNRIPADLEVLGEVLPDVLLGTIHDYY